MYKKQIDFFAANANANQNANTNQNGKLNKNTPGSIGPSSLQYEYTRVSLSGHPLTRPSHYWAKALAR